MHAAPAAFQAHPFNATAIGGADELLPRHPIFRTRDLDCAREHIAGVFGEHRVTYLPRERRLDFRHREARLGPIAVNSMQYGAGVMVNAALGDLYLVQFTLAHRPVRAPAGPQQHPHARRVGRDHQSIPALYKDLATWDTPTDHPD
jgi:hypothetical protein